MADHVECDSHGECPKAFVCVHLTGDSTGLGFNRDEPSEEYPFPDAWCDNCELIRAAGDGWNEKSEKLCQITLICSECYERSQILNTRPTVTLHDLKNLRWKCGSCEEWHYGPCLDFAYGSPHYWGEDDEKQFAKSKLLPSWARTRAKTFLTEDICAIEGNGFFVRGVLHLPILGCAETFRWGVWGSLSEENFKLLRKAGDNPERVKLPSMFSWLSNQLPEYPETLNLKMQVCLQEPPLRPTLFLERTDHPLAMEFHHGISPARVKEIMLQRLAMDA